MEKQVILSKTEFDKMEEELKTLNAVVNSRNKKEFDKMEQELKTLNAVVNSRKISALVIPTRNWSYYTGKINRLRVEYILGIEERQVIRDLEFEIKRLNKEIGEYKDRICKAEYQVNNLHDKLELEKSKPWYKKLFNTKTK